MHQVIIFNGITIEEWQLGKFYALPINHSFLRCPFQSPPDPITTMDLIPYLEKVRLLKVQLLNKFNEINFEALFAFSPHQNLGDIKIGIQLYFIHFF